MEKILRGRTLPEGSNPLLSDNPLLKFCLYPLSYAAFKLIKKAAPMDAILKFTLYNRFSNQGRKETVVNLNFLSVQVWVVAKAQPYQLFT